MTQIATQSDLLIPQNLITNEQHDGMLGEMTKVGDYLPRLQLFGSRSVDVGKNLISMGNYGLKFSAESVTDLGKEPVILPIRWRPLAMHFTDDNDFHAFYDPKTEAFKKCMADSDVPNSGCQYGPQFLVFVPEQNQFAEFFLGSKTARKQGPALHKLLGHPAQLKVKFIESGKFSWHGPVVLPWNAPISRMPDPAELERQVEKFRNPKGDDVEVAEPAAADERPR